MNSILNLLFLNMKGIINKNNILLMIFIIFVSIIPSVVFLPWQFSLTIIISIITIIIGGLIFSQSYNFKKSTLYNNFQKNIWTQIIFYIQTFCLMLITVFVSFFVSLIILTLMNEFDLLLKNFWWNEGITSTFNLWFFSEITLYMYQIFIIVALLFAISFAFRNFFVNQKTYLILIIFLVIISIIWGGILDFVRYDKVKKDYFVFNKSFFLIGLLNPFYLPLQSIQTAASWFNYDYQYETIFLNQTWIWSDYLLINLEWIIPPIEIFIFGCLGIIFRKTN